MATNGQPQGQWLTKQTNRTTPEIMDFISMFFKNMMKGGFGQQGQAGGGNLEEAYGQIKNFNYDKWVEGILGKLKPTDLSAELEGLKGIPETLMQQYRDILLPEFESGELNKIKDQFAGMGLHGSSTARAITEGYSNLNRGAMSNYLQAKAGVAQQEADIRTRSKMSFEDMRNQAMLNLSGGKTNWMMGKGQLAQGLDQFGLQQSQAVNPYMQMALQFASQFDPYNTATIYQQLSSLFGGQKNSYMNRNQRFVPGQPNLAGSTGQYM